MCRKVEFMCEESSTDIPNLLEFFQHCKSVNEYFYWDAQIDRKIDIIKNIFWSHASQHAECRDFGDVITFDTTHKTKKTYDATGNVYWVKPSATKCGFPIVVAKR
jgi:hypothetical protein